MCLECLVERLDLFIDNAPVAASGCSLEGLFKFSQLLCNIGGMMFRTLTFIGLDAFNFMDDRLKGGPKSLAVSLGWEPGVFEGGIDVAYLTPDR